MALNKLNLIPDSEGYTVSIPSGVLSVQLDGGAPRTRLDVLNTWPQIGVQWTVDGDAYAYLRQAARYCEINGGAHFLIDLILESGDIETHEAAFVPGTFNLASQKGVTYVVKANLIIKPTLGADSTWPADSHYQDAILAAQNGDLLGT